MIKLFAVTCVTFGFTYRVIHLCSVYDDMVEKSSEDKWYCSKCMHIDYECSQPSDSCSGSVADCLKCLCLNARSIFPKRLDLAAYLASLQYDIIAITESFLDDSITHSLVVPPSYVGYRLDRNRHGGGILVLVRDCLTAIRRSDLESDCELLWLELFTHIEDTILFYVKISTFPTLTGQPFLQLYLHLVLPYC